MIQQSQTNKHNQSEHQEDSGQESRDLEPLLGVGEGDEHGGVGELEHGADGVDGGDEDDAVGDEGEAVPHADEAVEQRVDVRRARELLRGSVADDPLECGERGDEEHEGEGVPCDSGPVAAEVVEGQVGDEARQCRSIPIHGGASSLACSTGVLCSNLNTYYY